MKKSVALISGGFDPLHRGHISYINSAKEFSDYFPEEAPLRIIL